MMLTNLPQFTQARNLKIVCSAGLVIPVLMQSSWYHNSFQLFARYLHVADNHGSVWRIYTASVFYTFSPRSRVFSSYEAPLRSSNKIGLRAVSPSRAEHLIACKTFMSCGYWRTRTCCFRLHVRLPLIPGYSYCVCITSAPRICK